MDKIRAGLAWFVDHSLGAILGSAALAIFSGGTLSNIFHGFDGPLWSWAAILAGLLAACIVALLILGRRPRSLELCRETVEWENYNQVRVKNLTWEELHVRAEIVHVDPPIKPQLPLMLELGNGDNTPDLVPIPPQGSVLFDVLLHHGPRQPNMHLRGIHDKPAIPRGRYTFTVRITSEHGSVKRRFRSDPDSKPFLKAVK